MWLNKVDDEATAVKCGEQDGLTVCQLHPMGTYFLNTDLVIYLWVVPAKTAVGWLDATFMFNSCTPVNSLTASSRPLL